MNWTRRHHDLHEAEHDVDRALKHLEESARSARVNLQAVEESLKQLEETALKMRDALRLDHAVENVDPKHFARIVAELQTTCDAWARHGREPAA